NRSHTYMHRDLYRLWLESGAMELLTTHPGEARFEEGKGTPDGGGLYLATDAGSDFLRPAYLDLTTRELHTLDTIAWDVDAVKLSPDGRVMAIVTNEDGYSRWSLRNLHHSRELPAPELPPGVCGLLAFAPDSPAIALTLSGT